jgi:hypothetical protein
MGEQANEFERHQRIGAAVIWQFGGMTSVNVRL